MKRDYVDFSAVPQHQREMHARLENWAIACFSPQGSGTSPMFRLYRSDEVWDASPPAIQVDAQDAHRVGKGVAALPTQHRLALNWCYVKRTAPIHARRAIGCSSADLLRFVIDGRQMLINRRV